MKSNEVIQKDVQDAIRWEPLLNAAEIGVTAKDGLVTLSGTVDNPDLIERFEHNWPLAKDLNMDLFYSADEKGYTDYPEYRATPAIAA